MGGNRALAIALDLTGFEVDWPAVLHVGLRSDNSQNTDRFDHFDAATDDSNSPAFISAWSAALDASKGSSEAPRRVERRFTPLSGRSLNIWEDMGDSIARHLWDGSVALTAYFDRVIALNASAALPILERAFVSATFKRLNVIELGCGCGIVGIALAQTIPDCDVLLTDLEEVRDLVDQNISTANTAISSKLSFESLDWEQPLPPRVSSRTFDIIIAAECIYNSDSIPLLVETLRSLIKRSPKAIIIISTKFRHESEKKFFQLMAEENVTHAGEILLPIPGIPGTGYGDFSTNVNLHLFHGPSYREPNTAPNYGDKAFASVTSAMD